MADFSNTQNLHHIRSISLPSRSYPSTTRIEQSLTKLQIYEPSSSSSKAESICTSLSGLEESLKCINEALRSSSSLLTGRKAFKSLNQPAENWVKVLLEESVRYIDICSHTREVVIMIKQSLQELQSAIRRRRRRKVGTRDSSIENIVKAYFCSRKNMKKEIQSLLTDLKHVDHHKLFGAFPMSDSDGIAMRVLREASSRIASILKSLLLFLLAPMALKSKTSSNRWPLVSKLVHKGVVESEGKGESISELEKFEIELTNLVLFHHGSRKDEVDSEDMIQSVQRKMEGLYAVFECLEHGLENLFRCLINIRVSLLNVISDH